ncbi:hypothetical protein LP083-2_189 [Listeria phage LP-083-2]|uniref:Uncharacterized protein n=3 Tax=Pecentumvirus TaxID=1857844 RepID=A0A059T8E9_9CAUD|nr:hypothetical protein LP083-2_189 [Listeria phage LP-083-2]YP_009784622.1 hypothetical protein QLX40_gp110 [Listeria phage LP-124]AHL19396.1 hypothetical protein LP083-2_189 [Listeria phage LP-083-2]AHL19507.1 hypothetical protein LP124_110 [Listeria phage LP-124]QDK05021.2 hypothetical protein FK486_0174 [Listeria phage LP-066]
MAVETVKYFVTNEKHNGTWAYSDQTAIVEAGNHVLVKVVGERDQNGEITNVWTEEVSNYFVNEERYEQLLKYGYYGKEVTTTGIGNVLEYF